MMVSPTTTALIAASLGASALGGALGMASGIFIVPLLVGLMGMDIHAAIGASLLSVIACSCGGVAPFLRARLTNLRLAVVLEAATTGGAATGVLLSGIVPVQALYAAFTLVLLVSAAQMLARRGEPTPIPRRDGPPGWAARLDGTYPDPLTAVDVPYRVGRLPLALGLMYAAGVLSALLGIGSGVLKIPAMDTALRMPLKVSSATSNFMIGVTAAGSAGAYFLRGDLVPSTIAPVVLGSVVGAQIGAKALIALPTEALRLVFVAILAVLAVQMALAALGIRVGL